MDPDSFLVQPSADDVRRFGDAILFGYRNMDRLIGDFLPLELSGTTLVFSTALSQQPFTKFEEIGGKRFYRPRDVNGLLRTLGVRPRVVQPVMTHQHQLRFNCRNDQVAAVERLRWLHHDGRPLLQIDLKDDNALYVGCQLRTPVSADAVFVIDAVGGTARFFDHFYLIDAIKSGCYHPDGALWIKTGQHRVHEPKVSILDIMPTVLDYMGIDYRPSATHPFRGTSLVPQWRDAA